VLIYFILPILCNGGGGGNQLREILGEGQEVLDPHELLKPIHGMIGGLVFSSLTPVLVLCCCWSPHSFTHSFIHSCMHSISLFAHFLEISLHSFSVTHSSFLIGVLAWGKENELLKSIHGIIGCRGRWCNPAMT
jgi:hypothetical protein